MSPVVARITRDVVTVSGPDAASFLQGQLTQDVEALHEGGLTRSFVLSPQGKVEGWGRVERVGAESFRIDVEPGTGTLWAARLERFLLRTKAEIELHEDLPTLAVRGADLPGGLPVQWPGQQGADLIGYDATALPASVDAAAEEMSPEAFDALRIRAGVPRWGTEMDADTIPATLGQWIIDVSVSFTKGCYTGQELVARIDSRGGNVPRRLAGLVVDGPAPERGAVVVSGAEDAGAVTSSAPDAVHGGAVALLFVPRAFEVPEDGLDAEVDGTPARLAPLPLPVD